MPVSDWFLSYPDWLSFTLAQPEVIPVPSVGIQAQAQGTSVQVSWLAPGVLSLVPEHRLGTKSWILSAGVHGDETAPAEWLNALLNEWVLGTWSLNVPLLCLFGHPLAMVAQRRYLEQNLNRLFGETLPAGLDLESQRARALRAIVDDFASTHPGDLVHYDMHAAIKKSEYEYFAVCQHRQQISFDNQCAFLAQAGLQACLLNPAEQGNTFSFYTAHRHGAEAATLELGQLHPFGANDLTNLTPLTQAIIGRLTVASKRLVSKATTSTFYLKAEIIRQSDHFEFFVDDQIANFTAFAPGALIARDQHYQYRVGSEPEYILFPNPKVPNGHRVAIMATKST